MKTQAKSGWLVAAMFCGASLLATPSLQASVPWEYLLTTQLVGRTSSAEEQLNGMLRQARQAMQHGDLVLAEQLVKRAEQLGAQIKFNPSGRGDSPAKVRKDLQSLVAAAGKPAAANFAGGPQGAAPGLPAAIPPGNTPPAMATITDMPAGGAAGSDTLAPVVTREQLNQQASGSPAIGQVRQLMAQAHLALQKGDVAQADQLARQAVAMQVPDNQFAPQEPRPWTLLMQVNQERQRRGGVPVPAGPQNPVQFAGGAAAAQGAPNAAAGGEVRPASAVQLVQGTEIEGLPEDGTASGSPAAAEPVLSDVPPADLPTPTARQLPTENPMPQEGSGQGPYDLIRRSEEAMKVGNWEAAERLLSEAWKYQAELDPATRQSIQDQLQGLQARTHNVEAGAEPPAEADPETQKLFQQVLRGEAAIQPMITKDPQSALKQYDELVKAVREANVESDVQAQLLNRLKRTEMAIQRYVGDNRAQLEQDARNKEVLAEIDRRRQQQMETDEKLAKMVDEFNKLMDEQRFAEARVIAQQARDLAPEVIVVQNMLWQSRIAEGLARSMSLREQGQLGFEAAMASVEASGVPFDDTRGMQFSKDWESLTNTRRRGAENQGRNMSEAEIRIRQALQQKVEVHFKEEPLGSVISTLGKLAGVNVFLDPQGLSVEGLTSDTPVSLDLTNEITLKSALSLILDPLRLTYVVRNEVLHITSEQTQRAAVFPVVYNVADLVIPIPNFVPTHNIGMAAALREAYNTIGYGAAGGAPQQVPLALLADRNNPGANAGTTLASTLMGQSSSGSSFPGMPNGQTPVGSGPGGLGGGIGADFDSLINLITTTIQPDSWQETGEGTGSIEQFATNLSLVVTQSQEVHDQIADLLEQLRRLQDLQVTIEVRFLTLNDNFFERIGVDFDFDLNDNTGFDATTLDNRPEDGGNRVTIGIDQDGEATADLDLAFTQDSFNAAVPPAFAGFDPASAATFGFAILSDIEAFFVVQAAQGDSRTNVLQAPKVTLFNGQLATVSDQTQRSFVQTVIPVVGDFAVAHQPVIMVLSEGTSLSVQAVISSDRRFVRLTMMPLFSTIDDVQEFRFEGSSSSNSGTISVDPTDNNDTVSNNVENAATGTTIQLPTFSFTSVSTTVSVPDGGTVLLGGVKRMTEGRNERGVPILSKIPYINRLFKNVGIGRTTSSLMMMVTPRIIIQEEEEAKLGIQPPTP